MLGAPATSLADDFFDHGGGSLTAAQTVSFLRRRYPEVAIGDIYDHPTIGKLAEYLDGLAVGEDAVRDRSVPPTPFKTQAGQVVATTFLRMAAAPRWLAWLLLVTGALKLLGLDGLPTVSWWWLGLAVLVVLTPPGRMLLAAAGARLLLLGVGPGNYPRGGRVHLRLWAAERLADQLGALNLAGAPYITWYARLLGAQVGKDVDLHSIPPVTGLLRLGAGCSVEPEVDLSGYWIDGDLLRVGEVSVGRRARIGTRSMLCPGATVGDDAEVAAGSAVFGNVPDDEFWSGAPAQRVTGAARGPWSDRPSSSRVWVVAYAATATLLGLLPAVTITLVAWLVLVVADVPDDAGVGEAASALLPWLVPGTLVALLLLAGLVLGVVRLCSLGMEPGVYRVRSRISLQVWATVRVLDDARTWLFPLYSSLLTPAWLRALGARIGRDVEASTVLMVPAMTHVNDLAFLADDTLIGGYELGGGWLRIERVKIGKRAFVGNSGMAAPGRRVPKRALVAVLSAAPRRKTMRAGESWIGSPPAALRRTSQTGEDDRTYAPPRRLKVARACWEIARLVPVLVAVHLYAVVGLIGLLALERNGPLVALVALGLGLVAGGTLAAVLTTAAKWLLVGRVRAGTHPLWSSFVWRNELVDTFVEVVAAPWFARVVTGTPLLTWWFRSMGSQVGRGVWCETYWLPEPDLIRLGDGATVNQGSVVQTHLFHDRLLATDTVTLLRGATLGPNSVILPAATIGRHATVGPVSLVMRGESVPDKTVWIGNPIGPWADGAAG